MCTKIYTQWTFLRKYNGKYVPLLLSELSSSFCGTCMPNSGRRSSSAIYVIFFLVDIFTLGYREKPEEIRLKDIIMSGYPRKVKIKRHQKCKLGNHSELVYLLSNEKIRRVLPVDLLMTQLSNFECVTILAYVLNNSGCI